jgi:exonuclease SbcC
MLITRIELENIKSYRHLSVDFRRGTTAISGANGAGKTTLVEAIGYALFNHLPYNQGQFVREGEKQGKIVIHLIGSDDRPYEVERRCGTGAQWMVYDCEADHRVEQRADVLDKLHELFGIDRERPLESLFRDALGVPQGTFTSIFLEPAGKRKQTFDALLQIEDYETAFKYLLEVRKQYDEQIQEQKGEIQRLEIETRELPDWRNALKGARQEDEQKKRLNEQYTQRLAQQQERQVVLRQQHERLDATKSAYQQQQTVTRAAQQLLETREQALQEARQAQQALEGSQADFARYQQADALLQQLRQDERERNRLVRQSNDATNALATIQADLRNLEGRLQEVERARRRLADLAPSVEQQHELERQRDVLNQQVTQYNDLLKNIKKLGDQQISSQQALAKVQRAITAIEPLQALAEQLAARLEHATTLQAKINERGAKRLQFEEKSAELLKKSDDKEQLARNLRKAEDFLAALEEHRAEAEEMPELQSRFEEISAQRHRLEGNIESYRRSRNLSIGGQCPLLNEPCQNIKVRGLVSLEFYFDGEIQRDQQTLAGLTQQVATVVKRIGQVKRYADELGKIGFYLEKRDGYAERLRIVATDITRLEREVDDLQAALDEYNQIEQQIAQARADLEESKRADAQVRTLDALKQQEQQEQERIAQLALDIQERGQQAEALRDSAALLEQTKQALDALGDPRTESKAQQNILQHEGEYAQQLLMEQERRQEVEQSLGLLRSQLARYASLDAQIGEQEGIRQVSQAGYHTFLKNQDIAHQLPEREQAYQEAFDKASQGERDLQAAEAAYAEAQAVYNAGEERAVEEEIARLNRDISVIARDLTALQDAINDLTRKIERAETQRAELDIALKEKQTLEDLNRMLEHFRKLIKEAAPFVTKAILTDISGEANRIFCEIMGDRSAILSWENDYEVVLRRQGINRTFAQFSGGEQMSAALAIRLALLKKLSTLNIAFFDEPTQNMDELRRSNLAEQIRRVRGFDQLFVISHDDTFEQSLDSLVRLRKKDGETHLLSEEEVSMVREQVIVHAS